MDDIVVIERKGSYGRALSVLKVQVAQHVNALTVIKNSFITLKDTVNNDADCGVDDTARVQAGIDQALIDISNI